MMLWSLLLLPAAAGALLWLMRKTHVLSTLTAAAACAANLFSAILVWRDGLSLELNVKVYGFSFIFNGDRLSALFLLTLAALFCIVVFHALFHRRAETGLYLSYLFLSLSMANGALLADHLGLLLFFWEGLLATLFGMLLLGNRENPAAAVKGLTMAALSDLTLMLGMAATAFASETGIISDIAQRPLGVTGVGALGCVCMLLGALGKAGCPFVHSWIPKAADEALPSFQPAVPGLLYPLLGGYLSVRILRDLFELKSGSAVSVLCMALGAAALLGGALMVLAQKTRRTALSWLLISQMGWAAFGLGTGLPAGLSGGALQFLFAALCCSGLLMAADDAEALEQKKIALPASLRAAVWVLVLAISCVPGALGFRAQSRIAEAAFQCSTSWGVVSVLGAMLSAFALLLIVRGFFANAPVKLPKKKGAKKVQKRSFLSLSIVSAAAALVTCAAAGPLVSAVGGALSTSRSSGFTWSWAALFAACAALALCGHLYGCRRGGGPEHAAEPVLRLPVLKQFCSIALKGVLDPYFWFTAMMTFFAMLCRKIEDGVCWLYDKGVPGTVQAVGDTLSRFDNGHLSRYLALALCGAAAVGLVFIIMLL